MPSSAIREWGIPELLSDLPHNIELEQALLGALLISNATFHKVSPLVTPADFYEPLHGRLFEAIGDLIAKNSPATPLMLKPFFEGETVGAFTVLQYLGRLVAAATTIINAERYAAAIADLGRRRELASIGATLTRGAQHDFTASLETQIASAEAELYTLLDRSPRAYDFTAGEAARMAIERIAAAYEKGGVSGLSTGFLESVRDHIVQRQSFLNMRRIEAQRRKARALWFRHSQSLANLRQRLSQPMVLSTIQRLGRTTKVLAASERLTISKFTWRMTRWSAALNCGP